MSEPTTVSILDIEAFAKQVLSEENYKKAVSSNPNTPVTTRALQIVSQIATLVYNDPYYWEQLAAAQNGGELKDFINIIESMKKNEAGKKSKLIKLLRSIKDPYTRSSINYLFEKCKEILDIFGESAMINMRPEIDAHSRNAAISNIVGRVGQGRISEMGLLLDHAYFLVYGLCQSGKTELIQCIGLCHMLLNNCASVNILQNSRQMAKQMEDRCYEFIEDHKRFVQRNGFSHKLIDYVYVGDAVFEKLVAAVKNRSYIVAIANETQLKKLCDAIEAARSPSYVLTIDEADQIVHGDDGANFRKFLPLLEAKAGRIYAVTATTFDLIFSEERIRSSNIIVLEPKSYYKGLCQVEMRSLEEDAAPANRRAGVFGNDPNILPWLYHQSTQTVFAQNYGQSVLNHHPIIALINSSHLNEMHQALFDHITQVDEQLRNVWGAVIYNSKGITIYHPSLRGFSKIEKIGKSKGEKIGDGAFRFKSITYKQAVDFFYNCIPRNKVTHIAVIAGEMAKRGISFTNYIWHLTHMYYVPYEKTSVSDMIQAAGRLCGNFNDAYPLRLWAERSVLEDIKKGLKVQQEAITRAKALQQETSVVEAITAMKFNTAKIPEREFGKKEAVFEKIQGEDGGIPFEEYRHQLESIRPASLDYKVERPAVEHEEANEDDFYKIKKPQSSSTHASYLYSEITKYLSHNSRKGRWIPLAQIRGIFPANTQQSLHDKYAKDRNKNKDKYLSISHDLSNFKGLAFKQNGGPGSGGAIFYIYK